jgi:hypothetical protein
LINCVIPKRCLTRDILRGRLRRIVHTHLLIRGHCVHPTEDLLGVGDHRRLMHLREIGIDCGERLPCSGPSLLCLLKQAKVDLLGMLPL